MIFPMMPMNRIALTESHRKMLASTNREIARGQGDKDLNLAKMPPSVREMVLDVLRTESQKTGVRVRDLHWRLLKNLITGQPIIHVKKLPEIDLG